MDSGISEIDDLLDDAGDPISSSTTNPAAKGAIQDLLRGHGFSKMPGVSSAGYGSFGKKTKAALLAFCKTHSPGSIDANAVDTVTKETLEALLAVVPTNPIACQVYVTRALDLAFTGFNRLACLVAIGEGQGSFAALCLNTDKAGLSAGMIQWAQYPGRLHELLDALPRARLDVAFSGAEVAQAVLDHTAVSKTVPKIRGGVQQSDGKPEDPAMDLTRNDWPEMFRRLCRDPIVQKGQITLAAAGFQTRKALFDAVLPDPKSERLVAYLFDVVNQFESAAPAFLQAAIDQGGLPAVLKDRDRELIDRVTSIANARLKAIGLKVKNGKQKWSDAMILKVQKSRTDRGQFFRDWDGLSDEAFTG